MRLDIYVRRADLEGYSGPCLEIRLASSFRRRRLWTIVASTASLTNSSAALDNNSQAESFGSTVMPRFAAAFSSFARHVAASSTLHSAQRLKSDGGSSSAFAPSAPPGPH